MSHSRFSASGSTRWMNCTASVFLEEGIEDTPSKYAVEGTLAHTYAEELLFDTDIDPAQYDNKEMIEGAMLYRAHIFDVLKGTNDYRLQLEKRITLAFIDPELYGTADCIIEDFENKELHVIDFKYGKTKVDPDCDQLKYYAAGAVYKKDINKIILTIVQPRLRNKTISKVRSYETTKSQLEMFCKHLHRSVWTIKNEIVEYKMGSYCFFCKGKTVCPEYQKKTLEIAKEEFQPITRE